MDQFTRLFESIFIGRMNLKNRIVFPAVGTRFAGITGEATQLDVDHYSARAMGGAGLIIIPWVQVDTKLGRKVGRHRIDSDEYIRGMHDIIEAVHLNDSKIAIQLSRSIGKGSLRLIRKAKGIS